MSLSLPSLLATTARLVASVAALSLSALTGCATETSGTAMESASFRALPQNSLRGELEVMSTQEVRLNGKATRLAPGSRIRNEANRIDSPANWIGKKVTVNYTVDISGHVGDVWVLSESERAVRNWPRTKEESQTWSYNPSTLSWTKP